MTLTGFQILHSKLIFHVQQIENDLRILYAAMKSGDFDDNFDDLEKASLGQIAKELQRLDYSDGHADLSPEDYRTIDHIREIRNYWCHQCYLDYIYLNNDNLREQRFQEIADQLVTDEIHTRELQENLEKIRKFKLIEYDRA